MDNKLLNKRLEMVAEFKHVNKYRLCHLCHLIKVSHLFLFGQGFLLFLCQQNQPHPFSRSQGFSSSADNSIHGILSTNPCTCGLGFCTRVIAFRFSFAELSCIIS